MNRCVRLFMAARPALWTGVSSLVFCGCAGPAKSGPDAQHHGRSPPQVGRGKITVARTNYHEWPDSILLSNGRVEAVIVPAIGRVMQFRFAGEEDGPFWENRTLDGIKPEPESKEWGNFGGDKTWPAPQSDWPKLTPRAWPPPVAFDSMPVRATVDGFVAKLVSAVDPHYGIRVYREITLALNRPVMTITTTYEKVSGQPFRVGVWVITQLKDPVIACASLPEFERFRE